MERKKESGRGDGGRERKKYIYNRHMLLFNHNVWWILQNIKKIVTKKA